jgi:hypothetical protein
MPGIGPCTGARILAEIGDGPAFRDGGKLAAYAGLAPATRQSGTSLATETRSRRRNHKLKNAMFLAAFASLRDPASKAFYDRELAEGNATTRSRLPGPQTLRRHLGHAPHQQALPARPAPACHPPGSLTHAPNPADHPGRT